jgi:crotonobetainyl-CoA:carnitine CoA-transferase CaiB-like acyl-CoA transferase
VQSSLLQAQIFMLDFQASRWLMDGEVAGQAGNDHPTSIPTGVFETSDGYINIASAGQAIWERLRDELGDERLMSPDFSDGHARSENRAALNALINESTRADSSEHWIERLNAAGVPCGEINSIDKAFASPQVEHLGMARDMVSQERGPTQIVGQPIIMSRSRSEISQPPPTLGQHTGEILAELGYDDTGIARLREEGIV